MNRDRRENMFEDDEPAWTGPPVFAQVWPQVSRKRRRSLMSNHLQP
jgi:hypothetical protein